MHGRDRSRSRDPNGLPSPVSLPLQPLQPAPPSNVPDWAADLFPTPGYFGSTLLEAAKPLEVPQSLVPILTDALVKQISEESAASITLRQDTRNLGYSLVLFSGSPEATQKAREAIQKYCGLTSGPSISKTLELHTYHSSAFYEMGEAMKDFKNKIAGLQIKLVAPERLGAPFKVTIGPGPVAHVSTAEATIRKTLREVELELHYKQRRTVPPELKHAMMCKNTREGIDCPNKACPFCHSPEELEIASRCCYENSISVPGQTVATTQKAPTKAPPIITAKAAAVTGIKGDKPKPATADDETSGLL